MTLRWLVIVAGGLLIAADAPKDSGKQDLERLEGTWVATSAEANGEAFSDEATKSMKLVVKGDKYTFTMGGEHEKGTLKLDPTKKPKTIDIHITEGTEKGKTQLGLYELEGDTLKVCVAEAEKDRPKEFGSKEGSGHGLLVFKRSEK
jgi:uncharacterized protein (TIGR03067 family)